MRSPWKKVDIHCDGRTYENSRFQYGLLPSWMSVLPTLVLATPNAVRLKPRPVELSFLQHLATMCFVWNEEAFSAKGWAVFGHKPSKPRGTPEGTNHLLYRCVAPEPCRNATVSTVYPLWKYRISPCKRRVEVGADSEAEDIITLVGSAMAFRLCYVGALVTRFIALLASRV